jgi:Poly(3-hydroxybutyrate) depolymerase
MIRSLAWALAIALGTGAAAAETIEIGGVTRSYLTQFPETKPAPLVVVLHGNTQTGADIRTRTSWSLVAGRERFGVIYPDGLNHAWADLRADSRRAGRTPPAGTDDVGFIVRLIEKYVADGTIDPKRVYVTGLSNGGAMTMTLVCARANYSRPPPASS